MTIPSRGFCLASSRALCLSWSQEWTFSGRWEGGWRGGVEKKNQIKISFLSSAGYGYPSDQETFLSVSFSANTSKSTSLGTRGPLVSELPPTFSCDTRRLWIIDVDCQVPSKPGTAGKTVPIQLGFEAELSDNNNSLLLQPQGKHFPDDVFTYWKILNCDLYFQTQGQTPCPTPHLFLQTATHSPLSIASLQHNPKRSRRFCFNTALSGGECTCTHLSKKQNGISHSTYTAITSPAHSTFVFTWKTGNPTLLPTTG